MAREKEGFRDQLESIIAFHPKGELMTILDVAAYTGLNKKTAARRFVYNVGPEGAPYITRTQLARQLVG